MLALLNILARINGLIERAVMVLGALLVALAVVVVFGGAVTRHLTGIGYSFVLELPPMLMPWLVFPVAGALLRGDRHIAVDFLPERLGSGPRRALRIVVSVIALLAALIFANAGAEAVALFRDTGQLTEMEIEFPIWWMYLSFPVGFAILASFALENLLYAISGLEPAQVSAFGPDMSE